MMKNENREHCKSIAQELEKVYSGELYRCPQCGDLVEAGTCRCGAEVNEESAEPVTLWEYFEDALDIEYRCGGKKEYRSVRIMVTCGGPNIYIDTAKKAVQLYWWTEYAEYPIDSDVCDEIDSIFEECFNCL